MAAHPQSGTCEKRAGNLQAPPIRRMNRCCRSCGLSFCVSKKASHISKYSPVRGKSPLCSGNVYACEVRQSMSTFQPKDDIPITLRSAGCRHCHGCCWRCTAALARSRPGRRVRAPPGVRFLEHAHRAPSRSEGGAGEPSERARLGGYPEHARRKRSRCRVRRCLPPLR